MGPWPQVRITVVELLSRRRAPRKDPVAVLVQRGNPVAGRVVRNTGRPSSTHGAIGRRGPGVLRTEEVVQMARARIVRKDDGIVLQRVTIGTAVDPTRR